MQRFKNILFFADAVSGSSTTLRRALRLAEMNHARLTVIDVVEPIEMPGELRSRLGFELDAVLRDRRLAELDALIAPFKREDTLIYTEVLSGTPFVEAIRAVQRRGYDLLIKEARHPEGVSQHLFGSTDLHLLRKCPCPVWIDCPSRSPHYQNVLAAVDPMVAPGQGCDRLVMELACSLAERESARLTVVHAWRLEGESMLRHGRFRLRRNELDELLEVTETRHRERLTTLLTTYGIDVRDERVRLVKGAAAPVIRGVAEQVSADLIVLGTLGRTGVPGFFIGNTAEEVIQTSNASVLAVKPTGFISPVA